MREERPAILFGLEKVALTKRQETELYMAELEMLRFHIGSDEDTQRWFEHLQRTESKYFDRSMLKMELQGRSLRKTPKRSFFDDLREDMHIVGMEKKETEDRVT